MIDERDLLTAAEYLLNLSTGRREPISRYMTIQENVHSQMLRDGINVRKAYQIIADLKSMFPYISKKTFSGIERTSKTVAESIYKAVG